MVGNQSQSYPVVNVMDETSFKFWKLMNIIKLLQKIAQEFKQESKNDQQTFEFSIIGPLRIRNFLGLFNTKLLNMLKTSDNFAWIFIRNFHYCQKSFQGSAGVSPDFFHEFLKNL